MSDQLHRHPMVLVESGSASDLGQGTWRGLGAGPLMGVLLGLVACASGPRDPPPELTGIFPHQGSTDVALMVTLYGRQLVPHARVDFSASSKSTVDSHFEVRLSAMSNTPAVVSLLDVRLGSGDAVTATVPAGVSAGTYDVTLIDSTQRSSTLRGAYQVVTAAEHVASFVLEVPTEVRSRVPFETALTAVDSNGLRVDGYNGEVAVTDSTLTAQPATVGPFVQGRLRTLLRVGDRSAANLLRVSDVLGHTGTSAPFRVRGGLPAAWAFTSPPASAVAGECSPPVELEIRDLFGVVAELDAPQTLNLWATPSDGWTFHSTAACAGSLSSLRVDSANPRVTVFFKSVRAGTVTLIGRSESLPSVTQLEIVTAGPPSALGFIHAPLVASVGACSTQARVDLLDGFGNLSTAAQGLAVQISATPAGLSLFTDSGCANPAATFAIGAGQGGAAFYFSAASAGDYLLRATASGLVPASQFEKVQP